ncbi:glycosyl transferase family 2 [Apibacter adventoris]|uniref:Glycosyl transferase family 2 n=1 Tax=Apibacter adventoris TaxID=1679466 RepID=A0A2S8AGI7_9FLAO|nr:glycosyl transferase family 2 [Apibacter adventoris]
MKIVAVVVTFNRLILLKECIKALRSQSIAPDSILIINNGSTDGTLDWLGEQKDLEVINQKNCGGSGGFYKGLKLGYEKGFDWVWVMDDDTIVDKYALENLLQTNKIKTDKKIGFISSKILWVDNTPNLPSLPFVDSRLEKNDIPFNYYDDKNSLVIKAGTFLSMLINREAIEKVGLPYKEFFIWWDDIEYSHRIYENNFIGLYSMKSIAFHKTHTNNIENIINADEKGLWKYKYGLRNEMFFYKKRNIKKYLKYWMKNIITMPFYILVHSNKSKFRRIFIVYSAYFSSIFFNPKIIYVNKKVKL